MPKILVVEDEFTVREVLEHALSREGMKVVSTGDGEAALERMRDSDPPDLVILDVMLPGMDGLSVCREIRNGGAGGANKYVPVVMLTARDDEMSIVVGLEVGADDYVTKPFSPRELISRVRAHLRRRSLDNSAAGGNHRMEFPGLTLDLMRREVTVDEKRVDLTAKEFDVLAFVASHPGRVYSRETIMRHLYDGDFFGEARAADVHIQHIRKKIESDPKTPRYIQTIRGAGYRFAEL
ncbi:MAG: response regulator transcription factor [Rubrobacteraceae bacterium]